jgi:hypothetical protein
VNAMRRSDLYLVDVFLVVLAQLNTVMRHNCKCGEMLYASTSKIFFDVCKPG